MEKLFIVNLIIVFQCEVLLYIKDTKFDTFRGIIQY